MATPYCKGALIWVQDSGSNWLPGTIVSIDVDEGNTSSPEATVVISYDADPSATKTLKFPTSMLQETSLDLSKKWDAKETARLYLRNPPALETVEDLANLSNLNEPSASSLYILRNRLGEPEFAQNSQRDPHIFAIAEEALNAMRRGDGSGGVDPTGAGDQTIVVSGESGAGKTVATKYILRYFASAHDLDEDSLPRKGTSDEEHMSEVEKQILASNPIMEAFGNAKTTKNDNSSRFGKYIQVLFGKDNGIIGAQIRTYLLERSRLIFQPDLERNYHIFYQLLAGAPLTERKELSLSSSPSDFVYLSGGGPSSHIIPGVNDGEDFAATQKALSTIGISVEKQWHVFKLLAALLHLGNVHITQARNDAVLNDDDAALVLATSLLGLPLAEFKKWTIKKQLVTRNEKVITNLGYAQATVVKDSVAKFIYSCLFQWLVNAINQSLTGDISINSSVALKFIGVLDIYGFEHFTTEFNTHVFKLEQEEYVREGIEWKFIDFMDNQACIDIIEGKMGILTLLDEESRLPAGSDSSFATKIFQVLTSTQQQLVLKKPRFNQSSFTIAHYAHEVTYSVEGFIEKNKDTVPDEHLTLLQNSTNELLRQILDAAFQTKNTTTVTAQKEVSTTQASKKSVPRKPTLGSLFKTSLMELMNTINSTNVHYIRCIKPNEDKKAWKIEQTKVLGQLRACGLLETIRISCAGYPSRWDFVSFAERYHIMLMSQEWHTNMDIKDLCTAILAKTIKDQDKYQLGLTKIFFRAGVLSYLESLRSKKQHELVTTLQKYIRRHLDRKHYKELRKSTVVIQLWWKGIVARRIVERMRKEKAAVTLQAYIRGWLGRRNLLAVRKSIILVQSGKWLESEPRDKGQEMQRQPYSRCFVDSFHLMLTFMIISAARRMFQKQRKEVTLLQSLWRRKLAVNHLKMLKVEAKSAEKIQEHSYQLENKVIELTRALQKKTADGKELATRINLLEDELKANSEKLEKSLTVPTVPKSDLDLLIQTKDTIECKLQEAMEKISEKDVQIQQLIRQLQESTEALELNQLSLEESRCSGVNDKSTIDQLREELRSVREQLSRNGTITALNNERMIKSSNNRFDGSELGHPPPLTLDTEKSVGPRRPMRRHSMASESLIQYDDLKYMSNPRAVSFIHNPTGSLKLRDSQGLPFSPVPVPDGVSNEISRLLEDGSTLDSDVLQGLIYQLKIPSPSLHAPPTAKEILFPAHLISLISNEMWKQALVSESERFLASVMQAVQQHILTFRNEDVIIPGVFWLSNVHEILSFVCIAEDDALKGYVPGSDKLEHRAVYWEDYTRLIGVVKHDLDSLEYNIYHTLMLEVKKQLTKMVIPAIIESQSLPGFVTSDGSGRMFSRMLGGIGGTQQPTSTMDDILNLLNKVWKCLKSYYMEESVMHQVITELLKLIGQVSFNDLIMRRNFCSWKRVSKEWCKSHDMPEGLLQLEHLMQATKLLQLKKATLSDIDILFDVCWILSPTQVQKLISQYHTADYEVPLNPEILRAVAARIKPEDKTDQLLLTPEADDVGPYQLPAPREIMGLETYVPAWLNVPTVRRLATFVA
uniref:Putative MYO2 n=1 Tax=Cryptococcus depauperatus TaxID=5208 RepID=D2JWV7_9TREE|nr:putative MYO2 [Cryptococcus depauperatus]